MKVLFILLIVFMAAGLETQAQQKDTLQYTSSPVPEASIDTGQFRLIKSEMLPIEVKKALEAPRFKGWIINAAYIHKENDRYYVELKDEAKTQFILFNNKGEAFND